MANYIGIVHKDKKSDYGVSFPDFHGCVASGKTIDEARQMAHEALHFHIEGMKEDGEEIPAPSTLEEITQSEFYEDAVAVLVVDVETEKTVRFNVTARPAQLRKIDGYAKRHGMSRSGLLVAAALKMIEKQSGDRAR